MKLLQSLSLFAFALPAIGAALSLETRQASQCSAICGDAFQYSYSFVRYYSNALTDHAYTTNEEEALIWIYDDGYTEENIAGRIFETQQPGTVPFYRLYNSATVDHAYTTSLTQANIYKTEFNPPYADDGIAGYVYADGSCPSTVPFYWAYKPSVGDSFYTANEAEYNTATATGGYIAQGIAAYIYPPTLTNPW